MFLAAFPFRLFAMRKVVPNVDDGETLAGAFTDNTPTATVWPNEVALGTEEIPILFKRYGPYRNNIITITSTNTPVAIPLPLDPFLFTILSAHLICYNNWHV